jgi:hypothetical protein
VVARFREVVHDLVMSGGSGGGRRIGAMLLVGAAGLVVVVVLAGWGGPSVRGAAAARGSLFERTLAETRDDPSVLAGFGFGDVAAQRSLAGVPPVYPARHPAPRWGGILGIGGDYFFEDPGGQRDGLDILTGSVAFEIGQPPRTGALITGPLVDGAKVRAAVEKLGAVPGTVDGQSGLTWGAEGSQHPSALNQFGVGPGLGEFDRAIITAHTVIAARYASEVATLTGGGVRSAAADPTMASTSSCLGDVVAALGHSAVVNGARLEISAGVRRPMDAAAAAQEVLCVVASAGSTAGPTGAVLCSRVGPRARTTISGEPVSQLDTAAVAESGHVNRTRWSGCVVTDRASRQAGWLLDVLAHARDLDALVRP